MEIEIYITEVEGPKLADLRNIGRVPSDQGGRTIEVSNPSGSRIVVRNQNTGHELASGNGWSHAMQALADASGLSVTVQRGVGVVGPSPLLRKVLATWTPGERKPRPAARKTGPIASRQAIPASDVRPGMLVQFDEEEWVEVLDTERTQMGGQTRIGIAYQLDPPRRLWFLLDERVVTADPATIRLTPAQERLLRAVGQQRVSYYRGNREWAASHAKRGPMFKELMGNGRFSNRTQSGVGLDILGLIAYNHHTSGTVQLSGPGAAWLAAHPA